jgi:hypothetical protein
MRLADQIRLCTCSKRDNSPARCLARISVVESMLGNKPEYSPPGLDSALALVDDGCMTHDAPAPGAPERDSGAYEPQRTPTGSVKIETGYRYDGETDSQTGYVHGRVYAGIWLEMADQFTPMQRTVTTYRPLVGEWEERS